MSDEGQDGVPDRHPLELNDWARSNPRVAYNGGLVYSSLAVVAHDALNALYGRPLSTDEANEEQLEKFEASPEGWQQNRDVRAVLRAAFAEFAADSIVKDGGLTLDEFVEYLKNGC